MYIEEKIEYNINGDYLKVKTLSDSMKMEFCLKLYKTFGTFTELEKNIPKKLMGKVNNITL